MAYNVLVVDDSLPMRSVIKKTVKACGFDVGRIFDAANGKEALAILREEWLDIVLSDYSMPEMDGLQLIREMKKDGTLQSIPVVMVSTEGSLPRVKEFMERGAAGYIRKPFTPEQIRRKLNEIMGESNHAERCPDIGHEELDF